MQLQQTNEGISNSEPSQTPGDGNQKNATPSTVQGNPVKPPRSDGFTSSRLGSRSTSGENQSRNEVIPDVLHVFLLVQNGNDHQLAQIKIENHTTSNEFFKTLRLEYFRLRGFFRRWLGVWKYSHGEFYKVRDILQFQDKYLNISG